MKSSISLPEPLRKLADLSLPARRDLNSVLEWLDSNSLDLDDTQRLIAQGLEGHSPFFVGRPGGTESEGLLHFAENRFSIRKKRAWKPYPKFFQTYGPLYSGITYQTNSDLDDFSYAYMKASLDASLFAYGRFAPGAVGFARVKAAFGEPVARFEFLEPWTALEQGAVPWTRFLEGKSVLVVHPFENTITNQFERRSEIKGVNKILPDFDLSVFQPPVTLDNEVASSSWRENFETTVSKLLSLNFDVAIIGAGSYGLPIAHQIFLMGRRAIHLGGSTQLLFGIKGKRWMKGYAVSQFIDDSWVFPQPEDISPGTRSIEGGSYT